MSRPKQRREREGTTIQQRVNAAVLSEDEKDVLADALAILIEGMDADVSEVAGRVSDKLIAAGVL